MPFLMLAIKGLYAAQYLKLIIIWLSLISMDFFMEFRFEYVWPFWLLFRSVQDSFKYQGLLFSIFFVIIALMSDAICYFFIPTAWLFFLGSTYVWVQLLWNAERGICLPTVSLFFVFIYIEFAVRFRDTRNWSFNIDLCRPFASHCIGYPVVTLGFGVKSYISYKFRLRRQKEVQLHNAFYVDLLSEALPEECRKKTLPSGELNEDIAFSLLPNGKSKSQEESNLDELEYCEQHPDSSDLLITDSSGDPALRHRSPCSSTAANAAAAGATPSSAPKCNGSVSATTIVSSAPTTATFTSPLSFSSGSSGSTTNNGKKVCGSTTPCSGAGAAGGGGGSGDAQSVQSEEINNSVSSTTGSGPATTGKSKNGKINKDDYTIKLESDVKRLKSELQSSRSCEAELRGQVSQQNHTESQLHMELHQARQEVDSLQAKLNGFTQRTTADKKTISQLEKRSNEEKRLRQLAEQQLSAAGNGTDKKNKREDQATMTAVSPNNAECQSDMCKQHRQDLEMELVSISRQLIERDQRFKKICSEDQVEALRKERRRLGESAEVLRDENSHLSRTLKEENRIKQDLLAAYHSAMKEVTLLNATLTEKEYELLNLNMKLSMYTGGNNLSPSGSAQCYEYNSPSTYNNAYNNHHNKSASMRGCSPSYLPAGHLNIERSANSPPSSASSFHDQTTTTSKIMAAVNGNACSPGPCANANFSPSATPFSTTAGNSMFNDPTIAMLAGNGGSGVVTTTSHDSMHQYAGPGSKAHHHMQQLNNGI